MELRALREIAVQWEQEGWALQVFGMPTDEDEMMVRGAQSHVSTCN